MTHSYIIGVTGHRDIHPKAYTQVKKLALLWFDEILSHKSPENITLLSPLAAGADQLIAELAIQKGISLHVPLPFPVEIYKKDFKGQDQAQFLRLYKKANKAFIPATVYKQTSRKDCYFAVGAYVAQQSHLLVGVWNGQTSPEKTGGTNHIIRCQFEGFPMSVISDEPISHRETFWIHTPRTTDTYFTPSGRELSHYNTTP
ncbi:hypothetical protein [Metabacillus schmidteae]|uniref:hypothetical protein n=1 Tax=Metabacillus schmidteae TaxID=2730405 RepID=UPI00158EF3C8|nr:hypothetical protein [Metabacillus schmidteae]